MNDFRIKFFFFFLRQGLALSPGARLEYSGVISAHRNFHLPGSSHSPASASWVVGRLRQNCLNPGGGGCGEPRLHHCTPVWLTGAKLHLKKKKEKKKIMASASISDPAKKHDFISSTGWGIFYLSHFLYPTSADGHLGWFLIFAIVKRAAVKTWVQVSFWYIFSCPLGRYPIVQLRKIKTGKAFL